VYLALAVEGMPVADDRFNRKQFGYLPLSLVNATFEALKNKRNLDSYSTARQAQNFMAANRAEDTEVPELHYFLPHPDAWLRETQRHTIPISREAARILCKVLSVTKNSTFITAMTDYRDTIQAIAGG